MKIQNSPNNIQPSQNQPNKFRKKCRVQTSSTTQELKDNFQVFEHKIIEQSKQHKAQNKHGFSRELTKICQSFMQLRNLETLNKCCTRLAEKLVSIGNNDYAGIIYSRLLKLNQNNKKFIEFFANNSKKIAHRTQDWVHCIARCFDLRNMYRNNPQKQNEYRKNLYETKDYLTRICTQYEQAKKHYRSINRPIQQKKVYENMLASILCEIANFEKNQNPKDAKNLLEKALKIVESLKLEQKQNEIKTLLKQLKK